MQNRDIIFNRRTLLRNTALGLSGAALTAWEAAQAQATPNPAASGETFAPTSSPVILGYFPDWTGIAATTMDFTAFTHICHAFATVDAQGVLQFPNSANTTSLITAAHAKKARVLLSLGGAGSNASLTLQPPNPLADKLVTQIKKFGYDGIDVDWEGPTGNVDGARITALVKALRQRLPKALVTMAVPADNYDAQWFQSSALLPLVDWLNVMTYDFCGSWSSAVLHDAPLTQTALAMAYWQTRGIPAQKLCLGIPTYGKLIHAKRFGDPARTGTYTETTIAFNTVAGLIAQGWTPMVDDDAQAPYLVSKDGGSLITYDDAVAARQKGKIAHATGLRGVFFWEITEDFDGKTHTLARAARQGWNDPLL